MVSTSATFDDRNLGVVQTYIQSPDHLPDGSRTVVLIDEMLHVNGMQDQLGTVNRSQARRKRWFAHYPQSIAISALVTVIVSVPGAISSQLPVPKRPALLARPGSSPALSRLSAGKRW
jgi:hypothetical protein